MSKFSMNPKDYIRVVQTVYNGHGDKTWTLVAKDGTAAEFWNTLPCGFAFGKLKEEKHGDKTIQVLDCGAFDHYNESFGHELTLKLSYDAIGNEIRIF